MTYRDEIRPHRETIDRLNAEIMERIALRQIAALKIGAIKKKYGKPVRDTGREKEILDRIKAKASEHGLDPVAVKRVFKEIIRLCVEAEERQ
jgi:chorismate mutase